MKKIFSHAVFPVAMLAFAASCTHEDFNLESGDGNVSISVKLPNRFDSRSFGDGENATQLTYAVYQVDGEGAAATYKLVGNPDSSKTFSNLETNVNLKLVNNKEYVVLFWAQDADCEAFTPDWDNRTLSLDYEKLARNSENSDAFYATDRFTVAGAVERSVTLYRPFAQLNVGTNDLRQAAVEMAFGDNLTTTLTVSDVYTSFDFITGEPIGEAINVAFTDISTPDETEKFPVEGYEYLSMDYLLVPAAQSDIVNCTLSIKADGKELNSLTVPNVPVQANYRTNIYGQLLTSTTNFNVVIEPAFNEPSKTVVVNSRDALKSALLDPAISEILIPEDTEIDMRATGNTYHFMPTDKVINLEGKIVTGGNPILIANGAEIVINGGTLVGDKHENATPNDAIIALNQGKLTLNDTKLEYNHDAYGYALVLLNGDAELNRVTVKSDYNCFGTFPTARGGKITATDCTFIQTRYKRADNDPVEDQILSPLYFNGANYDVTLENCTATSYNVLVSVHGGAKVTINGGNLSSFISDEGVPGRMSQAVILNTNATTKVNNANLYTESAYTSIHVSSPVYYEFTDTHFNGGIFSYGIGEDGNPGNVPFKYTPEAVDTEATFLKPDGTEVTVTLDKKI